MREKTNSLIEGALLVTLFASSTLAMYIIIMMINMQGT